MKANSQNLGTTTKPVINYPWLLAVTAIVALFVGKGYRKSEPASPIQFVGPPDSPVLPESFLLKAQVGTIEIGNAFVVSVAEGGNPVILTAMHRFGPAGGLARVPSADTVAAATAELSFNSTSGKRLEKLQFQPLPIGHAGTLGNGSAAGDIAGISVSGSGLTPAKLSHQSPQIGAPVWLAIPAEQNRHRSLRAEIFATDADAGLIYFRFPTNVLTLAEANANTGAPMISPSGDVLGIHIGAAADPDSGQPYGLAQSTAKFLPHILQALNGPHLPPSTAIASTKLTETK